MLPEQLHVINVLDTVSSLAGRGLSGAFFADLDCQLDMIRNCSQPVLSNAVAAKIGQFASILDK
jgi:hypothetical protein